MSLLLLSSLLSLSSPSWVVVWSTMEISTLCLIPLGVQPPSPQVVESMSKYYLVQSTTGLILLATMAAPLPTFMTLSLMIKMGIPPATHWVLQAYAGSSWYNIFLMSTVMKLPPLVMLSSSPSTWATTLPMAGVILGSVLGLHLASLKKLFSASSVSHSSWLVLLASSPLQWGSYMLFYAGSLLLSIGVLVQSSHPTTATQFSPNSDPSTRWAMPVLFLSLGGMPPLLGFIPKWSALSVLSPTLGSVVCLLILSLALSAFFYLRSSSISLLSHPTESSSSPSTWATAAVSVSVLGPLSLSLFE